MEIKYLSELHSLLRANNMPTWGCKLHHIEEIEAYAGCLLPQAYKEFLFLMGRGGMTFLIGSSCFYNDIFDLKEGAKNLLRENGSELTLEDKDFVFFMHQGYQFAYFKLEEKDDPTVYYFHESENNNFIEKGSFSNYLTTNLKETIEFKSKFRLT